MSLKSKREVGGGYNSPLKKFRAHCDGYEPRDRKGQFAKEGQIDCILSFSKVQVLESDSPYPYETAQLILKFSDSLNSAWVVLEDSIAQVLGKDVGEVSVDLIANCDVLMEREDNVVFFTDPEGKPAKGTVWRVMELGGQKAGVSPFDTALKILEGKSKGTFIGDAVADPAVKRDGLLVNSILTGTFLNDQRVLDMYDVVEDIYVKKTNGGA